MSILFDFTAQLLNHLLSGQSIKLKANAVPLLLFLPLTSNLSLDSPESRRPFPRLTLACVSNGAIFIYFNLNGHALLHIENRRILSISRQRPLRILYLYIFRWSELCFLRYEFIESEWYNMLCTYIKYKCSNNSTAMRSN